MSEELHKIKNRSILSIGSLFLNSSYSAALGFVAFFILTLKSGVSLLGIYTTVLSMLSFFNYISNLGLGAALLQKKDTDEVDLNTVFYIQLGLSTLATIVGYFLTRYLFQFYKDLPHEAIYLYWSILVSFFFLTFKTIPSVLLEKKIKIYKVVFVQALENTVFYLSVIIFSLLGFDLYSLIIAVLIRTLVGIIGIYTQYPWWPRRLFSFKAAKSLVSYGLLFQGNSFLALIKDDLLILYLGRAIGLQNLGYVMFGKKYAEFSIRLVMDNINRVAFPIYSRFQKEKELLKKSLEKILFYESLLVFPIIIGSVFIFDSLLKVFPGYHLKWQLSLPSFYFFSASAFFVSLSTPFINLFNAIGKVKISLYFMVFWTIILWIFVTVGINLFGMNGVAIGFLAMSLTFVFVILTAFRFVSFSLVNSFKSSFFSVAVMATYLFAVRMLFLEYFSSIYLHIGSSILGAVTIYFFLVYKVKGKHFFSDIFSFLKIGQTKSDSV